MTDGARGCRRETQTCRGAPDSRLLCGSSAMTSPSLAPLATWGAALSFSW